MYSGVVASHGMKLFPVRVDLPQSHATHVKSRSRDEQIHHELALLQKMSEDDKDATILYYREKLAEILLCDRTRRDQLPEGGMCPCEIAQATLSMRECPVGRSLGTIQSLKEQLAAERVRHGETREKLEALKGEADADTKALFGPFDDLSEQAELTTDAVLKSGNDRLMELEAKELDRVVARWHEERESWHYEDDEDWDEDFDDEADTEILDEDEE